MEQTNSTEQNNKKSNNHNESIGKNYQPQYVQYAQLPDLPNSTATLILGIVSIASFWCYGLIGIVTGIIALSISSSSKKLYDKHPERYSEVSYKNLNAGRITAIIGLSLSGIWVVIAIIYFIIIGAVAMSAF